MHNEECMVYYRIVCCSVLLTPPRTFGRVLDNQCFVWSRSCCEAQAQQVESHRKYNRNHAKHTKKAQDTKTRHDEGRNATVCVVRLPLLLLLLLRLHGWIARRIKAH